MLRCKLCPVHRCLVIYYRFRTFSLSHLRYNDGEKLTPGIRFALVVCCGRTYLPASERVLEPVVLQLGYKVFCSLAPEFLLVYMLCILICS